MSPADRAALALATSQQQREPFADTFEAMEAYGAAVAWLDRNTEGDRRERLQATLEDLVGSTPLQARPGVCRRFVAFFRTPPDQLEPVGVAIELAWRMRWPFGICLDAVAAVVDVERESLECGVVPLLDFRQLRDIPSLRRLVGTMRVLAGRRAVEGRR